MVDGNEAETNKRWHRMAPKILNRNLANVVESMARNAPGAKIEALGPVAALLKWTEAGHQRTVRVQGDNEIQIVGVA
jgi:hypothetical protein